MLSLIAFWNCYDPTAAAISSAEAIWRNERTHFSMDASGAPKSTTV
jgi:hypothetical protein